MKLLSGILKVCTWVVYLIIILALLIAAPIIFGNKPIVVLSGSMEPAYPVGSITYYKAASFEEIQVGDAITFKIGEDSKATHRVVQINQEEQTFVTKGDNNNSEDANPVSYSIVQGKTADFAIPYAGIFISYIQRWYAVGACVFILLLDMLFGSEKKKEEAFTRESIPAGLEDPQECGSDGDSN